MPWLAPLMALIDIGGTYFKRKGEKQVAKHKRDLAIIDNQARLAMSEQEANASWEMQNLKDKDHFLRNFSFFLFTFPIVISVVAPAYAEEMFINLDKVPDWLLQIYFYMIAGVWGIAALKNNVSEIVSNMRRKK